MATAASWKDAIVKALKRNRSQSSARYMQVATVGIDGRPRNRTVVYRGFHEEQLAFITDTRSKKVEELACNAFAEIAWYMPASREQFRLRGPLKIVRAGEANAELQSARQRFWDMLSDAARAQMCWPHPGLPREEPLEAWAPTAPGAGEPPSEFFCLVLMAVQAVDHLQLKGNRRYLYEPRGAGTEPGGGGDGGGQWAVTELNP